MTKSFAPRWYHFALIGGGALGLSGLLYYLKRVKPRKKEEDVAVLRSSKEESFINPATATKEEVHGILLRVIESQDEMKSVMKNLIQMILANDYTFDEVYQKVKEVQPDDPLASTGISMTEFDELLTKYKKDPDVMESVARIVGMSTCSAEGSTRAQLLRKEEIIEIHKFMLEEIEKLVEEFRALPNPASYDMKTVTITLQVIVGGRLEKRYNITSDEIELAVVLHHQALASNPEFAAISRDMQSKISLLMG